MRDIQSHNLNLKIIQIFQWLLLNWAFSIHSYLKIQNIYSRFWLQVWSLTSTCSTYLCLEVPTSALGRYTRCLFQFRAWFISHCFSSFKARSDLLQICCDQQLSQSIAVKIEKNPIICSDLALCDSRCNLQLVWTRLYKVKCDFVILGILLRNPIIAF